MAVSVGERRQIEGKIGQRERVQAGQDAAESLWMHVAGLLLVDGTTSKRLNRRLERRGKISTALTERLSLDAEDVLNYQLLHCIKEDDRLLR